mmetsp:Transcript_81310/g.230364  ORF Transcript_81310/g.230364 Transcript_81310/m.230364 type:complete len:227 (-) Transcript_81310:2-682(-)
MLEGNMGVRRNVVLLKRDCHVGTCLDVDAPILALETDLVCRLRLVCLGVTCDVEVEFEARPVLRTTNHLSVVDEARNLVGVWALATEVPERVTVKLQVWKGAAVDHAARRFPGLVSALRREGDDAIVVGLQALAMLPVVPRRLREEQNRESHGQDQCPCGWADGPTPPPGPRGGRRGRLLLLLAALEVVHCVEDGLRVLPHRCVGPRRHRWPEGGGRRRGRGPAAP